MTLTFGSRPCTPNAPSILRYVASVTDDLPDSLTVTLSYSGAISGSVVMTGSDGQFIGVIGPFPWEQFGDLQGGIKVVVRAEDGVNPVVQRDGSPITLIGCPIIG